MTDKEKEIRRYHNLVVLSDFMQGKSLSVISVEQTNFPPRPTIEKDKNALEFVHRKSNHLRLVD